MPRAGCFVLAATMVFSAHAAAQPANPTWRIDSTGTYVCPPVDHSIPLEKALHDGGLHIHFDDQGRYDGASRGDWPDGPCHSPEDAAKLDQMTLPVCPSVDRSVPYATAMALREPHMRVEDDLHGKYEGVMHDVPDGPCRPRRPEEALLPVEPRCAVFAVGSLVPKARALTIQGAGIVNTDDGKYMGTSLPVNCAVWQSMSDLMERMNRDALSAAAAQLDAQAKAEADRQVERRHQELVAAIRSLAPAPQRGLTEVQRLRAAQQLDAAVFALQQIGFNLGEINETIRELNLQQFRLK